MYPCYPGEHLEQKIIIKIVTFVVHQWYSTYWQGKRSEGEEVHILQANVSQTKTDSSLSGCLLNTRATEARTGGITKCLFLLEDITILTTILIWKYVQYYCKPKRRNFPKLCKPSNDIRYCSRRVKDLTEKHTSFEMFGQKMAAAHREIQNTRNFWLRENKSQW
jgi:hypothetical protein